MAGSWRDFIREGESTGNYKKIYLHMNLRFVGPFGCMQPRLGHEPLHVR